MGNRFREKAVEEGLEGEVVREAQKSAVAQGEIVEKRSENRKRMHEEKKYVEEEKNVQKRKEEDEEKNVNEGREEIYNGDEVEEETPVRVSDGRGGRVAKDVAKVLGGDVLSDKMVLKQIPLLLLCMVYLLLVVANRYQVESLSRKKMAVQERVNELREQQIQLQKMNQNAVRISQIRDDLEREKGLGIMPTPPEVI